MSRHRNIRGRTFSYDDDYQDDDQWDSGSEYAMSPNSQRYMYNRSQESTLADNFFGLGEQQSSRQQQTLKSKIIQQTLFKLSQQKPLCLDLLVVFI